MGIQEARKHIETAHDPFSELEYSQYQAILACAEALISIASTLRLIHDPSDLSVGRS